MRRSFPPAAVVVALVVALAALTRPASSQGVPVFEDKPGTILENFGLKMSYQDAVVRIAFRPFVPATNYTEVALLPAFHGDDKDVPQNRGIGFEYVMKGIPYVLRQWPRAGGSLDRYPSYPGIKDCPEAFFTLGTPRYPRAIAWQTDTMVFALQPDILSGTNPNMPALKAEWARLAKRGVCR